MAKTNQEERRKAPILRFKGFTNDWEQVELNEIAKKRIEKNNNLVNNNVLSNSAIYGIIKQNEYFDKTIANNINNYYVVHKDDFVYNPRISNHAPFGPISRNNFNESGIMSPLYLVFYFSTKSLNNYLEMYFKSSKWYKFMYKNGNSGARADRFVIKDNDFFKMEVKIPNDKNEQNKISQILNVLNNLITLYERKSKLFSQMKEYLLDNLFAENEYPNLRFKGFTNAWEQHKFKNIFNYEQPTKYLVNNLNYLNKGIPVLTANKSFILGYSNADNFYKNFPAIIFDDFTLDSKYVDFPFLLKSSAIKILKSNENNNLYFGFLVLSNKNIIQEGHSRHYISVVQNLFAEIPKLCEQNKIAEMFKIVDNLITLYESKLKQIKKIKKELLDTMFI